MAIHETIEDYSYLWQDCTGRYVLIQSMPAGGDLQHCVVYDLTDKLGLIIEDDELSAAVKQRMFAAGVAVLDNLPQ